MTFMQFSEAKVMVSFPGNISFLIHDLNIKCCIGNDETASTILSVYESLKLPQKKTELKQDFIVTHDI